MDQARDAVPHDGDIDHGPGAHDGLGHDHNVTPIAGPPALAVVPPSVSARLRAAREALGLTTTDIAARTRITIRHIESLDRGDLAALPGRPYVLGFVRNYARAVGLDGGDLAAQVRGEMDASVPRPVPRPVHQFDVDDPAKTPSRLVTWAALALVVAVLAAGIVFWNSYYSPGASLPSLIASDPGPAPSQSAPPSASAPAGVAAAPVAAGPVAFTAREDKIWVKFYDGHGAQLLQKQLALGESFTVPADAFEPKLWTGRPDALTITIGGQPVAPLSDKRTIMRDVPVTAQALLARVHPAPVLNQPVVNQAASVRQTRHRPRRLESEAATVPATGSALPAPVASGAPAAPVPADPPQ
jgi:hypothetical protein